MKWLLIVITLLAILGQYDIALSSDTKHDYRTIAQKIKNKYDSILSELDQDTQRHYAQRMFRLSGDTNYIAPIRVQFELELRQLQNDLDSLNDEDYRNKRIEYLLNDFNRDSRKGKARYWLFKRNESMIFDLNLLYIANNLHDAGIEASQYERDYQRALAYLKNIDFNKFLLDKEVIEKYGAQAVNYVYYLYNLNLADIREEYTVAFQKYYDNRNNLDRYEFRDKIYGMTHFIFAASDYYQQTIAADQFDWIFEYFESNINRILEDATVDIIAEVGLCYLLTYQNDHTIVVHCQNSVMNKFDDKQNMILSPSGDDNLETGEHRNILAYMLLNWPAHLNQGPRIF